jgi:hypothetical protein
MRPSHHNREIAMKALRLLIAAVLLSVAAPAFAADADPASILPQDALAVVRLEKTGAQALLGAVAMPPVAKMFAPEMVSPFAYVNQALKLPMGTAEKIAPHVNGATLAVLPNRLAPAGDPDVVFIVSFDGVQWPRQLLAGLPGGKLPAGHAAMIGQHILLAEKAAVTAPLIQGDFPKLAASKPYQAAQKQAAGSLLWATTSVPDLLKAIRASIDPHEREELEAATFFLGLEHMTYGLFCLKHTSGSSAAELTIGLDGRPDVSLVNLLPVGKVAAASPAPADALAKLALNWSDAPKFFGGGLKRFRAMFLVVNPGEDNPRELGNFDQGIAQIEAMIGVPLDGLFSQLGGGVSAFLLPPDEQGMIGREDWAAVLALKKAEDFKGVLAKVLMVVGGGAMPPPAQDVDGLAVQSVPGVPVFFTVTPNALVVSGSPANVKRAVEAKKIPTESFVQLHLNAGRLLKSYGTPDADPIRLNINLARTADALKLTTSIEGVPLNDRVALATVPILAAMLMPALARAREAARMSNDRANLHNIGLAISQYRVDNNQEYPPNLKILLDKRYLNGPAVLVSAGDENPPIIDGMKCSYVYVGTPFPKKTPMGAIIAYTRPGVYADGRNALHADSAVIFLRRRRGAALRNPRLRNEFAAIAKLLGPALTEARKKELEKFYGTKLKQAPAPGGNERVFPQPPDR